jgi:N-acyl-L-homoserine lactone synthetase
MEWLYIHGIRDIVVEYHPKFIERHLELGFEVNPLGLPVEMDGEPVVAVHMRFDFNALHRTRVTFGVADSILMAGPQADAG